MSDSHHQSPMFDYQPALPISNGKTFMWLFLSTEIMFFAALIGTYIVLRFGASPGRVRTTCTGGDLGRYNTFVLICSSVTIVLALEAAKQNNARRPEVWMLLTLLLGASFWASRPTNIKRSSPTAFILSIRTARSTRRRTSTTPKPSVCGSTS